MNNRILITYATRSGTTVTVAETIALALRKRGFLVMVEPIKDNPSVKGYQAVIIGSAIRQGAWLPEAVTFLNTNQATLRLVRVALFTVHGLNRGGDEQSRRKREAYLDPLRPLVLPVAHVFFPGRIDPTRLSLFDQLMVKALKAPVGDFRDWTRVNNWADTLLTKEMTP